MSKGLDLKGVSGCLQALKEFPAAIQNKWMRIALQDGGKQLEEGAKKRAPTGANKLLKKNLTHKIQKKRNGNWTLVVGVKRGIRFAKKRWFQKGTSRILSKRDTQALAARPSGTKETFISPSRYLHLVEGGTRRHTVTANNAKVLAGKGRNAKGGWKRGIQFFGKSVRVAAKPSGFMYTTSSTDGPRAVSGAEQELKKAFVIEAAKAARHTANVDIQRG